MPALIAQRISAFGSLSRPIILPRFVATYLHMRHRSPEKIRLTSMLPKRLGRTLRNSPTPAGLLRSGDDGDRSGDRGCTDTYDRPSLQFIRKSSNATWSLSAAALSGRRPIDPVGAQPHQRLGLQSSIPARLVMPARNERGGQFWATILARLGWKHDNELRDFAEFLCDIVNQKCRPAPRSEATRSPTLQR
jgi:hypothetical protein